MATIAWYSTLYGTPYYYGGTLDTDNTGSADGLQEISFDAGFVEGAQAGVVDINIVADLLPDSAPGTLTGEYTYSSNQILFSFPGLSVFDDKPSGTWTIRVYVDGIPADGELVLTATNYGYGYYSDISWGWNATVPEVEEAFWTRLELTNQEPAL